MTPHQGPASCPGQPRGCRLLDVGTSAGLGGCISKHTEMAPGKEILELKGSLSQETVAEEDLAQGQQSHLAEAERPRVAVAEEGTESVPVEEQHVSQADWLCAAGSSTGCPRPSPSPLRLKSDSDFSSVTQHFLL